MIANKHQSLIFLLLSWAQSVSFQQLLYPLFTHSYSLNIFSHVERYGHQLDFLCWWSCCLHCLDQSLKSKAKTFFQSQIFLVFLLQEGVSCNMVASDSSCLPSCIISWRISRVKLEFSMFVISSEKESSTKWSWPSNLSVLLFNITDVDNNFLNGNAWSELESMILDYFTFTWAYYLRRLMR